MLGNIIIIIINSVIIVIIMIRVTVSFYIFMLELYYTFPSLANRNIDNNDDSTSNNSINDNDDSVDSNSEKITFLSHEFNRTDQIGAFLFAFKNFSKR